MWSDLEVPTNDSGSDSPNEESRARNPKNDRTYLKVLKSKPRNLRFGDRILLRLSTARDFDGLWLGTPESDAEAIFQRVEEALEMIRLHDPRRYQRLRRDISRIWIRVLPGSQADFHAAAQACELDPRFVRDATVTVHELAATIVHESAHARIDRCIPYREDLRHRIEAACRREELAFCRRVTGSTALQEALHDWLARPPSKEFWSNSALHQRFINGTLEALRYLGVPPRLLPVLRGIHTFIAALRKRLRLTWRWSRPRATEESARR
ncbi:MAG TPA: hypothetical protein VIT00_03435 [Terrimicrobiaceae bacterium]